MIAPLARPARQAAGVALLLALAALAGCKVGPNYQPPATTLPANWSATAPATQAATQPAVDLTRWWTSFNDPTLNALLTRAAAANLDVRQAIVRVREARASRGIVASNLFPGVNADGSFTRARNAGRTGNAYRAGLDAAWEVDVFGGVRRNIEAAEADINASEEDRRNVLLSTLAEVALNYLDLRGFQQQLVIARNNLAAQQRTADITRQRFAAGVASGLDVANAEALVATTASDIPLLESQAQQTIYSLSVLLGQLPAALQEELAPTRPIPIAPPEVPVGLPSDLLRRRPDVRRAAEQIHAATARIGVAEADLYPKFSLTGSLGFESSALKSFANWESRFWSIGPSVSWPIFDAGRIGSNIELQKALTEESVLNYQKVVLTAARDVESALVARAKEYQRRQALQDAVTANRRAVDLATRLYTQGQTDFLNVLSAQRLLFTAEEALVRSDQAQATNVVALYKALGGGWEVGEGIGK